MQLNKKISEDIIKIFHNSKGSVQNNIHKWTNEKSSRNEHQKVNSKKNYPPSDYHQANQESKKTRHSYIHREKTSHFTEQYTMSNTQTHPTQAYEEKSTE